MLLVWHGENAGERDPGRALLGELAGWLAGWLILLCALDRVRGSRGACRGDNHCVRRDLGFYRRLLASLGESGGRAARTSVATATATANAWRGLAGWVR